MTDSSTTQPESATPKKISRYSIWAKLGLFLATFALITAIAGFGYAYSMLAKMNVSLATMLDQVNDRIDLQQKELKNIQTGMVGLSDSFNQSKDFFAEGQKILADWHEAERGNFDKWHAAEAQYLVRLANDHLQFARDKNMALLLLKTADQALENSKDPKVLSLRQSIAKDIANVQSAPEVNTATLYLQLLTLNKQIDKLPLAENLQPTQEDKPVVTKNLSWWQAGIANSMEALRKIVIVRKMKDNNLPFLLPDEKNLLYQNLHAQNENVIWAALHRNQDVYQNSLARMTTWITQFFDQNAPLTKTVLQSIQDLQKINVNPPQASFSNTLQLFQNYFADINTVKS